MAVAIASNATRSTDTRLFNGDGCTLSWLLEKRNEAKGIPIKPKYFYEFGTAGHYMIESYINSGGDVDIAWDAYDAYLAIAPFDDDWFETKNGHKADFADNMETMFVKFVDQFDSVYADWDVYGTEVKLAEVTPNGTEIISTIDAVMFDDEGYPHVIDWKLGTSKSGKDMQLYVYWYLLRKNKIVETSHFFRGHFHYVNYSNPIGYTASGNYPGDKFVEAYIDNSERNRRSGTYLPNPSWFSCAYCEYKDECPIYSDEPKKAYKNIQAIELVFV